MSSANSESFTSSFPVWIPFTSFSYLIAVAKTSKTMLSSCDESRPPCLVPAFRGNAFNFSPLKKMFTVGLSYIAFIMLRYVPSMPAFWSVFIINGCWILSKTFSASIEIIIWFYLSICKCVVSLDWFACYSHLFKNFPQFVVIHTVKVFIIVNEAEVDIFLEFSCFFY